MSESIKKLSMLILAAPVFLTIWTDFSVSFDRTTDMGFINIYGSIPIGIIIFGIINIKSVYSNLLKHKAIILYLIAVSLINYTTTTLHFRVLIERINLILFFVVVDSILDVGINSFKNSNKIKIVSYYFIIAIVFIVLWLFNGDFFNAKGGTIFQGIHSYNFSQYGSFLIFYLFIISGYILFKNTRVFFIFLISSLIIATALIYLSFSRLIVIVFIIIFFVIAFSRILKFIKIQDKVSILIILLLNITYFIILFLSDGFGNYDHIRVILVEEVVQNISFLNILFPELFYEKIYLYSSHNQILEIYRTSGVIGVVYFIYFLLNKLKFIKTFDYQILSIYLFTVISLVVLPFTHPFGYIILGLSLLMIYLYERN
jgi:hypothetical protein